MYWWLVFLYVGTFGRNKMVQPRLYSVFEDVALALVIHHRTSSFKQPS